MKNSLYLLLASVVLVSCQDDEDTNNFSLPASSVQFSATEATSVEGSGLQQVRVFLDRPQEGSTLINFSVSGNVSFTSTTQTGDVRVITESPLVIPAGETEAFINFELLEDFEFESEPEKVVLTLTEILEGNVQLSTIPSERIFEQHVIENEYELNLQWDQLTSSNIDLVVELPDNRLLVSDNTEGFEKIVIGNLDQNTPYLVTVWYYQGNTPVNYSLSYQQAGDGLLKLQENAFSENDANPEFSPYSGNGVHQYKLIRTGSELVLIPR
jgi:hypothetical protein